MCYERVEVKGLDGDLECETRVCGHTLQSTTVLSPRPSLLEAHVGSGAYTDQTHFQLFDICSKFLCLCGRDLHLGMADLDFSTLTNPMLSLERSRPLLDRSLPALLCVRVNLSKPECPPHTLSACSMSSD
jgi:hypothetical protein